MQWPKLFSTLDMQIAVVLRIQFPEVVYIVYLRDIVVWLAMTEAALVMF